jgi:hypothetical protein
LTAFLTVPGVIGFLLLYMRTGSYWNVGQPADQPVPFRHDIHSGALAIDCRYCHSAVERAASAGMPSAQTCLNCHSRILQGAEVMEPIRASVALQEPVRWTSVHRLPNHAYFHHGAHVANGVGCETCHGRVDRMQRTVKTETLSMGWCLDCHRNPAPKLRPQNAITVMGWEGDQKANSQRLMEVHRIASQRLTDCYVCHR